MKIDRAYRKSTIPANAKCVFEGVLFDVYQWEQELFDGTKTTFEKLVRSDTVVVVPVLDDGKIVITEDSQPQRVAVTTFPGGRVEEGEDVRTTAARELLEETGLTAASMELYHEYQPQEKLDWKIYIFFAYGCKKVQTPTLDAGEKIVVQEVTFDEFITIAAHGTFRGELWHERVLEAQNNPTSMAELKKIFQQS